jgi:hypothetical protein
LSTRAAKDQKPRVRLKQSLEKRVKDHTRAAAAISAAATGDGVARTNLQPKGVSCKAVRGFRHIGALDAFLGCSLPRQRRITVPENRPAGGASQKNSDYIDPTSETVALVLSAIDEFLHNDFDARAIEAFAGNETGWAGGIHFHRIQHQSREECCSGTCRAAKDGSMTHVIQPPIRRYNKENLRVGNLGSYMPAAQRERREIHTSANRPIRLTPTVEGSGVAVAITRVLVSSGGPVTKPSTDTKFSRCCR